MWDEIVRAPPPVTAVWATFAEEQSQKQGAQGKENGRGGRDPKKTGNSRTMRGPRAKEAGVKVDVVADGGRRWIRVNT